MLTIENNKKLDKINSFGIPATADRFAEFETADDLHRFFSENDGPWYVFSGGNNILLRGDYHGTLLHPLNKSIEAISETTDHIDIRVGAGLEWDDLVGYACSHGWYGLENLSLIPGYVGAAPVQNIGAYGAEAKDTITSVEVYITEPCGLNLTSGCGDCPDGKANIGTISAAAGDIVRLSNADCRFGYRDSIFKRELRGKAIILSVDFRLSKRFSPHLDYGDLRRHTEELGGISAANVRQAVIEIRQAKLPDPKVMGNAGSFFKNPIVPVETADKIRMVHPDIPVYPLDGNRVKLAAGWLIDKAGWKGYDQGPAGVHDRQALVLVNRGGASGADILDLASRIRTSIREKFGVEIDMEVNIL